MPDDLAGLGKEFHDRLNRNYPRCTEASCRYCNDNHEYYDLVNPILTELPVATSDLNYMPKSRTLWTAIIAAIFVGLVFWVAFELIKLRFEYHG